jgi:hypothetical protein
VAQDISPEFRKREREKIKEVSLSENAHGFSRHFGVGAGSLVCMWEPDRRGSLVTRNGLGIGCRGVHGLQSPNNKPLAWAHFCTFKKQ